MALTGEVRDLVIPVLKDLGLELFDVHYHRAGRRSVLRIFIDKPGGVTIDDCQGASREIETLLDIKEVVPGSYHLEVSSPGINRPMRHEADYVKYTGSRIKVKVTSPIANQKTFVGINRGLAGGVLQLEVKPDQLVEIPLANVAGAHLVVDF
ncbi:MAG: ribosome maturation factor RimP [bacterium]|nr:ribosome maturation factor RimP [bacterium]